MKLRSLIWIGTLAVLLAGCSQNMEVVNSGERLEDSPKPVADTNATPLARPSAEEKSQVPPFVKAYFMHMWVEALYSTPQNKHPNPSWQSPLKDPVDGRVDRKSTRLNSSHVAISYAVFCLKKKKKNNSQQVSS